jgi:hypothetical protein
MSRGQPSRATEVVSLEQITTMINSNHHNHPFRLSFHVVGKGVCLVILWQNPARRDKPWNYIAPKFQRYTKHLLTTGNLYGHIENVWGILFPKGIEEKDGVLGE